MNETGCRQGDPLAGLVFCLGFHKLLLHLHNGVRNLSVTDRENSLGAGAFSFYDDVWMYVHRKFAQEIISSLAGEFGKFRLTLNSNKSIVVGQLADSLAQNNGGFRCSQEGGISMGVPFGTIEYRSAKVQEILAEMVENLPVLKHVHSSAGYNILKSCINMQPAYLHRVLGEVGCLQSLFQGFDRNIDQFLVQFMGLPVGENIVETSIIRSLPQAQGGLGIICHSGIVGDKGCLLSRNLITRLLSNINIREDDSGWGDFRTTLNAQPEHEIRYNFIPPHLRYEDMESGDRRSIIMESEQQTVREGRIENLNNFSEEVFTVNNLEKVVANYHAQRRCDLIEFLNRTSRKCQAALFLSSHFKGSGYALSFRGFFQTRFPFSSLEFQALVRLRLLRAPLIENHPIHGYNRVCQCEKEIDCSKEISHGMHCQHILHREFTLCHNELCSTLVGFIKRQNKSAVVAKEVELVRDPSQGPSISSLEPNVTVIHIPDSGERMKVRADIKFSLLPGTDPYYVDVTVADPSAPSYRDLYNSSAVEGGTAEGRERQKWGKYVHVIPEICRQENFIPFAVEATGRLGALADGLLTMINPIAEDSLKRSMINTINCLIMKWNARKLIKSVGYLSLPSLSSVVAAASGFMG
jgi:hypothetical protein